MAAKPIEKKVVDAIIVDWRIGQLSQRKIADKYHVSNGVVAKICKGVEQDVAPIVSAGVQYKQALSAHDERMVSAVSEAVDEIVQIKKFFRTGNMILARNVVAKVQADGKNASYQDLNAAASAIAKTQESVLGKAPAVAVQVNTGDGAQITAVEIDRSPASVNAARDFLASVV